MDTTISDPGKVIQQQGYLTYSLTDRPTPADAGLTGPENGRKLHPGGTVQPPPAGAAERSAPALLWCHGYSLSELGSFFNY